jgi:hypothetical protein
MAAAKIVDAMARLDDAAAMIALLAPMRAGTRLQEKLRLGFRGHQYFYDRRSRTARYLHTDGTTVVCFSIARVSLSQASAVAMRCDLMSDWSTVAFRAAVQRAIGVQLERMH